MSVVVSSRCWARRLTDDTARFVGRDDLDDEPAVLVHDVAHVDEARSDLEIKVHVAVVLVTYRHDGAIDRDTLVDHLKPRRVIHVRERIARSTLR